MTFVIKGWIVTRFRSNVSCFVLPIMRRNRYGSVTWIRDKERKNRGMRQALVLL